MLWLVVLVVALLYIVPSFVHTSTPTTLSYSALLSDVQAHKVKAINIPSAGSANTNVTATGTLTNKKNFQAVIPYTQQGSGSGLDSSLQAARVDVTYQAPGSSISSEILLFLLWIVLPIGIVIYLFRRMARTTGSSLQGVMGIGRSRAKVFDAEPPKTQFTDVAGYDGVKAEITEVVDFLRNPERYRKAGAQPPRGVLMVGPPGTGKTLIARAVAGEASVPFFSVAGSSFVEMFVGVGAARVRDLFAEARKQAPAIIFVDEIDAIGQRRAGGGAIVSNDEREQTLNQLLSEMDGFDVTQGIVVLGATNRPEVLDPALLRPGRFDRQIVIPLPALPERAAILAVHCRGKQLGPDVDLVVVARGTPGFSGADLANLANEAAIFAVRATATILSGRGLRRGQGPDPARPPGGLECPAARGEARGGGARGRSCAGGGAVRARRSGGQGDDPAGRPGARGNPAAAAGGAAPVRRGLLTESLAVRLGGRAAELVALSQGSTGAANDLASATELATKMVREFGLSPALGPVGYPEGGSVFLGGGGGSGLSSRPFAEATQATIDAEVARLLREAEQTAVGLIRGHRPELDRLVSLLLESETVDGEAVYRIVGKPVPVGHTDEVMIVPHPVPVPVPAQAASGEAADASVPR